jgi:3-hydroxyisobutyrate dehydrogenase
MSALDTGNVEAAQTTVQRIAVLGLGAMGLPMAARLTGLTPVSGFDPFESRRALAVAEGISPATTPAEAADGADALVIAVRDQAQTESALFGTHGALESLQPGALVLLTSTIGPDAAIAIGSRLVDAGFRVVDAPVSGGPVRAGTGELLAMVGAGAAEFDAARPILLRLTSTLTYAGARVGDGQLLKIINQLLAGIHIAAAAEAVALARGVGLDPQTVIDSLSGGAAASFMLSDRGPRMVQAYEPGAEVEVRSRVDIFVKDMGLVTDLARSSGVPVPVASSAEQLYLLAQRHGLGERDDSSVVTILSPEEHAGTLPKE